MVLFFGNVCIQEYIEFDFGICFEQDIFFVFILNCMQSGCYNSIDREEGYDFIFYEKIVSCGIVVGNYKVSEVYKVFVKFFGEECMFLVFNEMLFVRNIQNIVFWIDEGVKFIICVFVVCDMVVIFYVLYVQLFM